MLTSLDHIVIAVRDLPAATDLPRALIELEITDRELVRRERLRPARQRLHSREKLLERERFRHVIVGACA